MFDFGTVFRVYTIRNDITTSARQLRCDAETSLAADAWALAQLGDPKYQICRDGLLECSKCNTM